jgi:hypothetical protein
MENVRPSDGKRSKVPAIDLNTRGYRAGERVLFRGLFGFGIAEIGAVHGNTVHLASQAVPVNEVSGRVPAGMTVAAEAELLARLKAADDACAAAEVAARRSRDSQHGWLLREAGIR